MAFFLHIPLSPVPKGRPRFTKTGRVYTPAKTKEYEKAVAAYAREKWKQQPTTNEVFLEVVFYLHRPQRLMRNYLPEGPVPCPCKPDLDNLIKAIKDALNGILWADDGQVTKILASKYYHEKQGQPRIEIQVRV